MKYIPMYIQYYIETKLIWFAKNIKYFPDVKNHRANWDIPWCFWLRTSFSYSLQTIKIFNYVKDLCYSALGIFQSNNYIKTNTLDMYKYIFIFYSNWLCYTFITLKLPRLSNIRMKYFNNLSFVAHPEHSRFTRPNLGEGVEGCVAIDSSGLYVISDRWCRFCVRGFRAQQGALWWWPRAHTSCLRWLHGSSVRQGTGRDVTHSFTSTDRVY